MGLKMFARLLLMALIYSLCTGVSAAKELLLSGSTMGTTYHIKVVPEPDKDAQVLQPRIDQRLEQLNQSMSTYRYDSEISRFNRQVDML